MERKPLRFMKIKKFIIHNSLFIILVVAALLRLWNLDSNPPHLSPDEASLGYNAYSILKTGRDEYGELLPMVFKSFGDYKPGFYVYLTVPFVAVLGLNEWSVRLPSAIAGTVAVYLLYLLVKELLGYGLSFRSTKNMSVSGSKSFLLSTVYQQLAMLASLLLAISPWHLHLSRGAWEVNVSLTLTLTGILFFLKSFKFPKYLIISSFFFSLTFITYQGAKLSTAIVILTLFITFLKDIKIFLKINWKTALVSLALAFAVSSPALLSFTKGQTGRLTVFSIFSYPRPEEYLEGFLSKAEEKVGDLNYYLFHSETLNFKRGILGRYFNHFSGRFLFFEGDYQNPKHSSPNHGMLQFFDIVLIPIGLISLIRHKSRMTDFVLLWLLLSPLPAVLTRDQVQAVRAFNMVIPLAIVSAYGALTLINYFKKFRFTDYGLSKSKHVFLRYLLFTVYCSLFTVSFLYFLDSYFIHLPIHNAKHWSYGYKQVIEDLLPIQNNYKTVYFQQSYDQPYIYYLFYSKYDPAKYQKNAILSYYLGPDVGLVEKLDNIRFSGWSWPYATGEKSTLIIGNSVAIPGDYNPKDYNLLSEIEYPDNFMTAFRILETK